MDYGGKKDPGLKSEYTCNDYRAEMILVSLHKRLAEPGLDPDEAREIKRQIKELSLKMGLD